MRNAGCIWCYNWSLVAVSLTFHALIHRRKVIAEL